MRSKRITRVEFPARTISPTQPPPTKRVAAYARVSTMKDAQENSFQSQQEYFTEYIQRHPGWVFAGMYTDDGISGLSIRRRDGFNRMVADALDGKIDLILMILSRLVDTFFSRISLTMQPPPKPHSTACVLPWEEGRHWQSRSSGCSSS